MLRSKTRNEFILLLALLVFGVACLLSESGADALILENETLSVSLYANLLAVILLVFASLRTVLLIVEARKQSGNDASTSSLADFVKTVLFTMVVAVFFVVGMRHIGFYICTCISLFIMYMNFEQWNKKELRNALIFSVGLCIIFFVAFKYLKVFLPRTPLF